MTARKLLPWFVATSALAAAFVVSKGVFAQARDQAASHELTPALLATRAALEKYKDPMQAVKDGYLSTTACIESWVPRHGPDAHGRMGYKPGAMGVHFLNPAYVGPALDSTKPQVLVYEPQGNRLVLVAAEWFMPVSVSKTPPKIFGQTLMGPMEGHERIMPTSLHHFDLHVWLWRPNPNGLFHGTNTNVKCPKSYGYSFDDLPPRMAEP